MQSAVIYHPDWIAGDVLTWGSHCAFNNVLPDGHSGVRVTFNRVTVS